MIEISKKFEMVIPPGIIRAEDLIKEGGYSYATEAGERVARKIPKVFETGGKRVVQMHLLNLGCEADSENPIRKVALPDGLVLAGMEHLLLFGANFTPLETDVFVVAAGDFLYPERPWCTLRICYRKDGTKLLFLNHFKEPYNESFRFLLAKNGV